MMDTMITISGPGSCINNELAVISKALLGAGYTVEVVNQHPERESTDEELIAHITKVNNGREPKYNIVKIVMDHQPWPG